MPLVLGEAAVVDLTDKGKLEPITAEDMEERGKHVKAGDIVLLKTGWTEKNAGGNTENLEGLPKNTDYWKGPYPARSMALSTRRLPKPCRSFHRACPYAGSALVLSASRIEAAFHLGR